jgi:hypothetical protein
MDLSTVHHVTNLFARDPLEREIHAIKVIRATKCPVKEFNQ